MYVNLSIRKPPILGLTTLKSNPLEMIVPRDTWCTPPTNDMRVPGGIQLYLLRRLVTYTDTDTGGYVASTTLYSQVFIKNISADVIPCNIEGTTFLCT